jgi:isoleucyl-tRNA synthetase
LVFFLVSFSCYSQDAEKIFVFKELGWTLSLPVSFKILDSIDDSKRSEKGKKASEETNNIEGDISKTRTLISAIKNTYNYFNSTITPFDPKKDGSWDSRNKEIKNFMYQAFSTKMEDAKIDSLTTTETIDGLQFDKYKITVTIDNKVLFTTLLLSRFYKGYDFGITYLYLDAETKEEIEQTLMKSKFEK